MIASNTFQIGAFNRSRFATALSPGIAFALAIAYGGGLWLHLLHEWQAVHERVELPPVLHWLRDSTLALPAILVAVWVALLISRRLARRLAPTWRRAALAGLVALATTFAFAAGVPVHAALFVGEHSHAASDQVAFTHAGVPLSPQVQSGQAAFVGSGDHADEGIVGAAAHALKDGLTALPINLGIALLVTMLLSVPAQFEENKKPKRQFLRNPSPAAGQPGRMRLKIVSALLLSVIVPALVLAFGGQQQAVASTCGRTVFADVVALDQQFFYNRLGAWNPAGMIYALRRDVIDTRTGLTEAQGGTLDPGFVALRADKRPRPLVLRANIGDCLAIRFTNLLNPIPIGGQPADRHVGIHVNGLELVNSINDDGSFVGLNPAPGPNSGLAAPGQTTTYNLFAQYENTFLLYNMGGTAGGEGGSGTLAYGLFGAVNVQPSNWSPTGAATWQSEWYRSQLTRVEMDWATPPETFTDWNGNLVWDAAVTEPFINDWNGNGTFEANYPELFINDWNGNGTFEANYPELFEDTVIVNGTWDSGEPFTDLDGDGVWDASLTDTFTDLDGDGVWDASLTDIFTDWNSNSVWDAGIAEPLVDTNGNGLRDAHRTTPGGQPILDYEAVYPVGAPFGKVGLPIIKMLAPKAGYAGEIVHSDINAIITGPGRGDFPNGFYPANDVYGSQDRNEPYREFTVIFHDEVFAFQAFQAMYDDPTLAHALAIVKDGFAINYGTGGIGSEIIANRLGVGPMANCVECKYEEFFLTSFAVGDPAMLVDNTADAPGAATKALYPDDPSNVHHSYLNDHVKFRQLHAGTEHHIFHLHGHQWQYNWNDPNSNYLDSQGIGPGSGFTYEIAYGGSGNRNKSPGDAIFHCHFYPHFAMGMWELWRVHDTFEQGTELNGLGVPVAGARALPDGEITAGTPIPGLVPLPSAAPTVPGQNRPIKAMAPMPDPSTSVVAFDGNGDGVLDSSQLDLDANGVADLLNGFNVTPALNPGFPFFIPGIAGHRPPTPALDIIDTNGDGVVEDGGLPRHIITGGPNLDPLAGPVTHQQFQTRLDFNKELLNVGFTTVPEAGTPAEQVAMAFHNTLWQPSYLADGTPVNAASPINAANGRPIQGFETNGLPAEPGAPFADPCRTDPTATNSWAVNAIGQNKTYKGVNIQFDMTMNKVGWHFQQQRILTLWDDAAPVLAGAKAPEPLVMRLNAGDCASYWHANLVPNVYELDDYQVRTPTDIIGQHIHLVKFDVIASDGSANGWNYEDGTLSPLEVQERIRAIRAHNACAPGVVSAACPEARTHPFFGAGPDNNGDGVGDWVGARTTVQRWYADPLLNNSWDNGLGTVFTHDHYGPSTHQQVGLYATVLIEPTGAQYRDPETGVMMGTRHDGGPTSWRADILNVFDASGKNMSHREFYFEFGDFQHAYKAGGGALTTVDNGAGVMIPSYADFANAIAPSFRVMPPAGFEDALYFFPPVCPGPVGGPFPARPCPEAISGADPGTYVTNYRNEPMSERVYDPLAKAQAAGQAGDLAYAFSSLVARAQGALNAPFAAYPPLTADVGPSDPATPLLRAYMGDKIRLRVQVGAHEEEHNFMIHGLKWNKEPLTQNSGWKNSEFLGISEYAIFEMPVVPDTGAGDPAKIDYLYTMGAQVEDYWNGIWGLLRSYGKARNDLLPLPNNPIGAGGVQINNAAQFNQMCPVAAPVVNLKVTAVRAADILPGGTLIYNDRTTTVIGPTAFDPLTGEPTAFGPTGRGPLHDPTALMYVRDSDLLYNALGKPVGLKPGVPVEPLILRARAGDCINLQLTNALPASLTWTDPNGVVRADMPGFNTLPPITHKDVIADPVLGAGIITFNANDLTPSSVVGLHPQLLAYNIRTSDGFAAGGTSLAIVVPPGGVKTYRWYAGDVDIVPDTGTTAPNDFNLVATPVEFGATGLLPADRIKGSNKGLVGALIVEPQGSTWVEDPASRASATVTKADGTKFRDFVTILQNDLSLRYTADNVTCTPALTNLFCAVRNIHAEGGFVPEDPQDSAQKAINYGADPVWFRLGVAPETPFGQLLGNLDIHRVFSNGLAGADNPATPIIENDPQTAVFLASPSGPQEVRLRIVAPGGHARGIVYALHGHAWQREPYINNSTEIGKNPHGWWNGAQEGIGAGSAFNIPVQRGGYYNVIGDYLFRDLSPFGSYQGLWGIFRHNTSAPMAGADFYVTPKNVALNVAAPGVLANDVDLDGDALTAQLVGGTTTTAGGTVTFNPDGSFNYTPLTGFTGVDTFQYQACAGAACSATATVSITVGNAPVAVNDAYSMVFGNPPLTVAAPGVLANDSDPDGDPLVVGQVNGNAANVGALITLASGATVTVNADGSLTYTPLASFIGTDSFTYRACENIPAPFLCSNLATVTTKVNAPPVAANNSYSGRRNTTLSVNQPGVLGNDTDPNGDALNAVLVAGPASGSLNLRSNGSFSYNPPRNFTGIRTFTYKACEASTPERLCSNIVTVTITITP